MNYQELMKQIKNKTAAPVYFFTGPEVYIAQMMEHMLIDQMVMHGMEQMNLTIFTEKDPDISEIITVCEMLPLMSQKRVVIIREETGIVKSSDKKTVAAIEKYLNNPSPSTVLIFYDQLPDKRKKIYKTLKEKAVIVDYQKLNRLELQKWIGRRLKLANKQTTRRAVDLFIDDCLYLENEHSNMEIVDHELNKIIDYTGDRPQVTVTDIETVMPKSIEDNIFKMIDYAMENEKGTALTMLGQFYLEGESPFGVYGLLLRQIRIMLMIRILKDRNMTPEAIAKEVKLPPFIVRKTMNNSKKYSVNRLKRTLINAAELDLKMKTGKIDAEFAVEWFIMEL